MGHDHVQQSSLARAFFPVLVRHQKIRKKRHELPENKECDHVACRDDQQHGTEEKIIESSQKSRAVSFFIMLGIRKRKKRQKRNFRARVRRKYVKRENQAGHGTRKREAITQKARNARRTRKDKSKERSRQKQNNTGKKESCHMYE